MSSKAYSKQQRETIRIQLLKVGTKLYATQGIKQTHLQDILSEVNISKPFFYKFYPSLQEFIIAVLDYQWLRVDEIICEIESHKDWDWEQKARKLLFLFNRLKENKLIVMSQEEEVWVYKQLSQDAYEKFMSKQLTFFERLLLLWEIPQDACNPYVLANLVLSMTIVRNYGKEALPFLYTDKLDESSNAQIECIIQYLKHIKTNNSQ